MIAVGFLVGLVLLILGADLLVRGASRLAVSVGVAPLVIGLTVVAFGTSAPELAVTIGAGLQGKVDLSVGNVVGSNIFNVLFILGVSALIYPLAVDQKLVRTEVPLMVGVSLLLLWVSSGGGISRLEGILLVVGLAGYLVFLFARGSREGPEIIREYGEAFGQAARGRRRVVDVVKIAAGLGALVLGADQLVDASVEVARRLGVDELLIGLTLVSAGTSLPEVATSVVAAFRRELDIAVGNVVGSNVFNVLGVLGLGAAITPGGLPVAAEAFRFDLWVVLLSGLVCLPVFISGARISRREGVGFLIGYTSYIVLIYLRAQGAGPTWLEPGLLLIGLVLVLLLLIAAWRYRTPN